ncbi:MAG: hypothetical protein VR77_06745 [Flavobacteriales bacterium BRH_c54]|nr:MAG: hypothetical protein VR77_06745 [Flavobacteriales bacterium BRH_c54]
MTLEDFKRDFCFKVEILNQGNINFIITTVAIRRQNNQVVDKVKTTIDIQETTNWIVDSNSMASITSWNWDKLLDETKRAHLDYFAQRAPIDDWYPLNKIENPDISNLYC